MPNVDTQLAIRNFSQLSQFSLNSAPFCLVPNFTFTLATLILPLTTLYLTASYDGSIVLKNSILIFILSLTCPILLPTPFPIMIEVLQGGANWCSHWQFYYQWTLKMILSFLWIINRFSTQHENKWTFQTYSNISWLVILDGKNYSMHLTTWWQWHILEICTYRIYHLVAITLVLCYDWMPWIIWHTCNYTILLPLPKYTYSHVSICMWWMWTDPYIWLWQWYPSLFQHCWCSQKEVAVDLIGPWPAPTQHNELNFFDLSCISTTTNLVDSPKIW